MNPPLVTDPPPPAPVAELWHLWLPLTLGAIAVYLLLPRPRNYPRGLGGAFAAGAILATGWWLLRAEVANPPVILFYAFSFIAVAAGGMMLAQTNPVHAALSFALVVLSTCGLFLLQAAPFLMAATIIVYAGAIVVTFLFVIMLAQQAGRSDADHRSREPLLATIAGFVLLGALLYLLQINYDTSSLDANIVRIREAARQPTRKAMIDRLGDEEHFFENLGQLPTRPPGFLDRRPLEREWEKSMSTSYRTAWEIAKDSDNVEGMRAVLEDLDKTLTAEIRDYGSMQPVDGPLSPFSGGLPRNADAEIGAPAPGHLPADNVGYLGRALFTDYLVAVELAGTLLLVAAIGAIAITHRRTEDVR